MTINWLRYRRLLKVLCKLDVVEYTDVTNFLHAYWVREQVASGKTQDHYPNIVRHYAED